MAAQQKKKKMPNNDRRNIWLLILTTLLIVGSVVMFMPPTEKINQGLDIQGGLSVVLTAKNTDGGEVTSEVMEASRDIIESRVNALGASETVVQVQGTDQILVQIPGLSDTEEALNTIGKTGELVFARLDSFTDETVKNNIENGNVSSQETITDEFGNYFPIGDATGITVEEGSYTPLVSGANIQNILIDRESEGSPYYAVNITLDSEGAAAFAKATQELASTRGKIVIILDGEVQSAPAVQSVISDGSVSITGGYDSEGAKNMQTILESGSLPVSFEYSQSQVVGPTLGQDALRSGIIAAGLGLIIVMLYLLFFYRGLGLVTAGAMIMFAIIYLGILAALSAFGLFSLSLAGIAGIVLTIGMAADSSILTIERFREEIRMGRSVRAASITGVSHAIKTSILADLVTLISAVALFALGSASVKGFGLTLGLGIICDILMMLVFKAPMIRLLAPRSIAKHPTFWGTKDSLAASDHYTALAAVEGQSVSAAVAGDEVNAKESEEIAQAKMGAQGQAVAEAAAKSKGRFIKRDFNFLGHRKVFLIASAVLIIASFAVIGFKEINLGIEFQGGTSVAFHDTGDITIEDMREAFANAGEPDATVQTTVTDNGSNGFLIRTATTSAEDATVSANKVSEAFALSTDSFEVTTIGPDWGTSVIQTMLIAFLVSIIAIIIFIAFQFEYKMGLMAVVSLLHDLILVFGVYALVGREVNPNTIAALLTILGYSLYDTVVVFHRIDDNMKELDIKSTFMTMANHSVNQVFIRSINTTLTSLIPVLAMLFFGGETLKDFAFAMAIGLILGSYSSIFVATPLYAMWKTREPKYAKLVKKYGTEIGRFEFGHTDSGSPAINRKKQKAIAGVAGTTQDETTNVGVREKTPSNAAKPLASKSNKQQSNHRYKRKKTDTKD